MKKYNLVILGAGPAGLTAAIYGRRAGMTVLVVERDSHGGQIKLTNSVENWPGTQEINGYDLGSTFYEHAKSVGTEFLSATVVGLDIRDNKRFVITSAEEVEADTVIVATGASFRLLGVPGEAEYTGRGVSYCAVCDGPFYRNQEVAVVGGGNTALQEAEYLTSFASKVHLIHRRGEFRAGKHLVDRILAQEKIVPHLHATVSSIAGDDSGVTRLYLRDVRDGQETELEAPGVFIFVGTTPHSSFLGGLLELAGDGSIITDHHLVTSEPGVFAAGDVRDTDLRQVVTAAADGARAAMGAYHFINRPGDSHHMGHNK
ncbi:thioredoxin-disulfide reductase [Deltaproteobacteria bacterium Smac51]|nr:thioredoxin-disulfide reductase [Deltaproteobacteria bacterium Smac51]